jgi:pyocin large subunit-like protein
MSTQALCQVQVANANPQLSGNAPGSQEKLQALIAACVKNYEQYQAQQTQQQRQTSRQPATMGSSTPGQAVPSAAGIAASPVAPRTALPAAQAPSPVNPTAASKPVADVPLSCSLKQKANFGAGLKREYEVLVANPGGTAIAVAYRIEWEVKHAKHWQSGSYTLPAPLAAKSSVKVGNASEDIGLPALTECRARARL